ncbi:MAG: hypothetical protein ACP5QN_01320 [Minisyncoccia bacterium]
MENKFNKIKNFKGKIEKISIPDKAISDWMKTLYEEGFSTEEIDSILMNANETYKKIKLSKEEKIIKETLIHIQNYIINKYNIFIFLNPEEQKEFEKKCLDLIFQIKKGYKEDFKEEIDKDLLKKILILTLEQNIDKKFGFLKSNTKSSDELKNE